MYEGESLGKIRAGNKICPLLIAIIIRETPTQSSVQRVSQDFSALCLYSLSASLILKPPVL